ncbi:DUF4097 family beta strand repeat-containing protein [Entomospira nematocerorum]|uniref:DUF4097 domain-containing protein n=1 Tax=Entomospira nematocerorum TaxID=2719987 RepID=A0A968KV91_9SPIO|nr:DUF4097 family beta strand repeat-containing protein [Entomospira nematocera]NIZ47028.1 DUF4097 domain-containing protein [Entomospira nematocera]WDI34427.1 DUF4097 family beta strand repeat-containing protein [Entomospira nematocera]
MLLKKIVTVVVMFLGLAMTSYAEEWMMYQAQEDVVGIDVEILHANVEVVWSKQERVTVTLLGDSSRNFPLITEYRKTSSVLVVGESVALGKRISDFWNNKDMVSDKKLLPITIQIQIPKKMQIPLRIKVLMGDIRIIGGGVTTKQSITLETLNGNIHVEDLQAVYIMAKSSKGDLQFKNIYAQFMQIASIYGNILVSWQKKRGAIFLRASQLAGKAMISQQSVSLPLQLESVGVIGAVKSSMFFDSALPELEIQSGYGLIQIDI